jgi:RNA polymerase sigma-32 factor
MMMQTASDYNTRPDALTRYLREIKGHELLTKEQQRTLVRRYHESDDVEAAHRLVRANLRLVVKIAMGYHINSKSVTLIDLIQQGNVGLVMAVKKYDPQKKTKFSYYASFWIKAYIFKYLLDNFSSVKIGKTQAQRKLFFNLRKTKEKLRSQGLPATAERIADTLGVKADQVREMEKRMEFRDQSLNAPWGPNSEEQLVDHLHGKDQSVEEILAGRQIGQILHRIIAEFNFSLTQREQEILNRRIVAREPLTLQKLGDRYGVSRERIRQIEKAILRKMRLFFLSQIPDMHSWLTG